MVHKCFAPRGAYWNPRNFGWRIIYTKALFCAYENISVMIFLKKVKINSRIDFAWNPALVVFSEDGVGRCDSSAD